MFVETKKEGEVTAPETWRELLLRAADEIERRGHAKRVMQDDYGQVCFWGALNYADHGHPQFPTSNLAIQASENFCAWRRGDMANPDSSNITWNDAPWRSGLEIVATMRACAREQ